jgi:MPBQ/MSBQ methyltransferase
MTNDESVNAHYGFGGIMEAIEAGLSAAGKEMQSLTVDDLAPIDEFHTRGRESTLEVAALAALDSSDSVLDVGCGLGGTARHVAEAYGCRVTGIDLTEEYVAVGQTLTRLVGLDDRVTLRQASALEIPFEDESFDVVWTEHVQMNIADKRRFYAEIGRVLRRGGRFVFHEVFQGRGGAPYYPAPWADEASLSALATEAEARSTIEGAGLEIADWTRKNEESSVFFLMVLAGVAVDGPPPGGIQHLMGDNPQDKRQKYWGSRREDRV